MVRCSQCGTVVSEWAARCPHCHGGLEAAEPAVEAQAPEAAAGLPPFDRPAASPPAGRPRRVAAIGVAVAVIGTAVWGVMAATDRSGRRAARLAGLREYTVVYTGPSGVEAVGLDGRRKSQLPGPVVEPAMSTSAGAVFVRNGTAFLLPPPYVGPVQPLGQADGLIPMSWPSTVGMERQVGGDRFDVRFLDLQQSSPSNLGGWHLPVDYRPLGQSLVIGPQLALRTWQPEQGGGVHLGELVGQASFVAGSGSPLTSWLAADGCVPDGECPLHQSQTPGLKVLEDRVVPPPAGHDGYLPGFSPSPDGSVIAAFVAALGQRPGTAQLVIIDDANDRITSVANSTISVSAGNASAQWTPDGSYLLFSGPGGSMHIYRRGDSRATTLPIRGSGSFTVGQ